MNDLGVGATENVRMKFGRTLIDHGNPLTKRPDLTEELTECLYTVRTNRGEIRMLWKGAVRKQTMGLFYNSNVLQSVAMLPALGVCPILV